MKYTALLGNQPASRSIGSGQRLKSCVALLLASSALCLSSIATSGTINYTIKTDIRELNTGVVDGEEFLTIQIDETVGPMACRSNILKLSASTPKIEEIEAVAFSALLQQDQVIITIPLQQSDCVDGNPAIVDMYLMHNS